MMKKKMIVIGGGPAGLAAAVSAVENGVASKDILILERDHEPGGILNQCIHAGFGLHRFGEELTGPEYAGRYIDMVRSAGIPLETDAMVLSLTADKTVTYVSPVSGYTTLEAETIILAMGCRERTRGALNIPGSRPAGIFTAGTAQRYVNIEGYMPGKRVVILGSGDIGLIMARRMTLEGAKVLCVCELMPYSGGLARNIVQCLDDFGIPLKLSHTVTRIYGKERVEGVTIAAVDAQRRPVPGTEETLACDTLLLSVGLLPENELTRAAGIPIDRMTNGAYVDQNRETEIPGIYACGNVLHVHDLVDFVSEEAAIAGRAAARRLSGNRKTNGRETDGRETDDCTETCNTIRVQTGEGVRYTVPECLRLTDHPTEPVRIFFRVADIYKKVRLLITDGNGNVLVKNAKSAVAPGEMESLTLNPETLASMVKSGATEICVSLEVREG